MIIPHPCKWDWDLFRRVNIPEVYKLGNLWSLQYGKEHAGVPSVWAYELMGMQEVTDAAVMSGSSPGTREEQQPEIWAVLHRVWESPAPETTWSRHSSNPEIWAWCFVKWPCEFPVLQTFGVFNLQHRISHILVLARNIKSNWLLLNPIAQLRPTLLMKYV